MKNFQKIATILFFLLLATAVACQAETTPAPTNTAVANTAMPKPTETAMPDPTATTEEEEPQAIPEAAIEEVTDTAVVTVNLDKPFTLKVGETAVMPEQKLEITLTAVTNDSRCPKDVTCVWEGEALVLVTIEAADKAETEFELNTNPPANTTAYFEYTVQLDELLPYPQTSTQIPQDLYEATFTISMGPK